MATQKPMGYEETKEELSQRRRREMNRESEFSKAEIIHQMLMEDFDFMRAARLASGAYEAPKLNYADAKDSETFKKFALAYPNGLIQHDHFTHRSSERVFKNHLKIEPDVRSLHFLARRSRWPPTAVWAHWLLSTTFFSWTMVVVIVLMIIGIAIDQELGTSTSAASKRYVQILELLDFFFMCMFVTEILLKWTDDFGHFWNNGWNVFDFLITVTSMIAPTLEFILPDGGEEEDLEVLFNALRYLRIVRIFRSLNVVTRLRKIQQIWAAVVKTFVAMLFITALMAIFFYVFAIVGIQLFDRYTRSHLPDLRYRKSFRGLAHSFVTLFQLFTLDHWNDLLNEAGQTMEIGIGVLGWVISVTYILIWILLGSFIFRNIFVGVMVNNFQNIRQYMTAEERMMDEKKKLAERLKIFYLDKLEMEHIDSNDPLVDWEAEIFHNLEIIRTQGMKMSPVLWPRDTMFQYYMLLEAYAGNFDARDRLFQLLDKALLRFLDS